MTRSRHNGCGKTCGICRPHKKWKTNSPGDLKASIQRRVPEIEEFAPDHLQEVPEDDMCSKCPSPPAWNYAPDGGFYCDDCVPRGCGCQTDDDGNELTDDRGRLLPCVEYDWIGGE